MSPPPLTLCSAEPAAVSIAAARSMAQPLTYPDGSNRPPGRVVKYPPLRALTSAQAASTSVSSGAPSANASDPRPNRLTSLSSRYGENVASTQCSHCTTRSRTAPLLASRPAQSGTSKDTTVPITGSACRSRPGRRPVTGRSQAVVDRALQRGDVARAGVAGPGYGVDLRVLRGQRLADQLRKGELADLDVVNGVGRLLEHRDLHDLVALHDQLDLYRAVYRIGHLAGDRGLARGERAGHALELPGYRPRRRRGGRRCGRPASRSAGRRHRHGRDVRLERQQGHQTRDGARDGEDHPAHSRSSPQNSNDSKWICRRGTPAPYSASTAAEIIPDGPHT